ncbi:MAG TPA: hypothetical protein VI790_01580 [Candidatus Nanoarchaeia archaeon]|nr:hypothetical protein [Candidatus Nanoarchaeia archaeon]
MQQEQEIIQSVVIDDYTQEDLSTQSCENMIVGKFIVQNYKVFNAIKESNATLKDMSNEQIVAIALKESYNIENSVDDLALKLSRKYNMINYHVKKFKTAKADTTSNEDLTTAQKFIKKLYEVMNTIEKQTKTILKKDDILKLLDTLKIETLTETEQQEVRNTLFRV